MYPVFYLATLHHCSPPSLKVLLLSNHYAHCHLLLHSFNTYATKKPGTKRCAIIQYIPYRRIIPHKYPVLIISYTSYLNTLICSSLPYL